MGVNGPGGPAGTEALDGTTLHSLLRLYGQAGEPLGCVPLTEGLLNRGYRLTTTRGRFFLKHHLDGDQAAIARQHAVTLRLAALGLPVAPPVADAQGSTVTVLDGRCYALHPWVEGRHHDGGELTRAQSRRLGALLGHVHMCLEEVCREESPAAEHPHGAQEGPEGPSGGLGDPWQAQDAAADPQDTYALIEELLGLVRRRPRDSFDELAEHRLVERRALLERHAHRRPAAAPARGWVHGDFHPLNLLYRGGEPAAIVDWDRLGVQPRAEEAVRAAVIFFLRPDGTLDLAKIRPYARAYRRACGADTAELAAAVHRVWWERLNDFWMLRWRYQLGDHRADPGFPASAALSVWWTRSYGAVREAFTD
ncbi:phosphotransferase [Streptomyces albireticuli]|uniref:Aminoglycoside phosphotransferase n=1 Tax=Streptomyces albireticuli TaxID=1940 RepID=A0A2A2DGY3_9ACTN|nr:phosphotransferase [Streptomyces albireticuli]MCD9143842.1 phosphotransferase [Streptomyces albireticuli]MCD9161727.1 phosphotransferase [Streptomyces albireticuli]MCD9191959.1 phosphotransferase [Streptomyces albireticuli]PAU50717.1 aminoglycoside phosphotransferase [Streptomyces albireticuli]